MRSHDEKTATIYLRVALGISFLSAVADRFGVWGAYGQSNVAWGDFAHFVSYTGKLTAPVPSACTPALAWMATVAETILGVALLIGTFPRWTALLSGFLLLFFAISMTLTLGVKAPLNYSVYTASAGAFLLAARTARPA